MTVLRSYLFGLRPSSTPWPFDWCRSTVFTKPWSFPLPFYPHTGVMKPDERALSRVALNHPTPSLRSAETPNLWGRGLFSPSVVATGVLVSAAIPVNVLDGFGLLIRHELAL